MELLHYFPLPKTEGINSWYFWEGHMGKTQILTSTYFLETIDEVPQIHLMSALPFGCTQ